MQLCEEWLSFKCFKEWYDSNYPYYLDEIGLKPSLDKDLIVEGNRIYSPTTCIFLPHSVNSFLTNKQRNNTSRVTGVSWDKQTNKWQANIKDGHGKLKHLGSFTNIEDAKHIYELARQQRCIEVQEQMRGWGYSEDIIELIKQRR